MHVDIYQSSQKGLEAYTFAQNVIFQSAGYKNHAGVETTGLV